MYERNSFLGAGVAVAMVAAQLAPMPALAQGQRGNGWNDNGNFAGEKTCRSYNNREQVCRVQTGNRVVLLQQYSSSPCIEGRTWRYTANTIEVRNGCQARFGYGTIGGDGWGDNNSGWGSNSGFAGQLECRSEQNRQQNCPVYTQNRVELLRQFSGSSCTRGYSWGYDQNRIWVSRGCQARFGYGYGNVVGDNSSGAEHGGGPSTGAIIGGLAIAGVLAAILASSGKGGSKSAGGSSQSANVSADYRQFPGDARVSAEACMKEAGRQIGASGGTAVKLERIDQVERSGNGWLIIGQAHGTWPDQSRTLTMDCRATGSKVTGFDVR